LRIINSDNFNRRYDDLYLGVTFLGHGVWRAWRRIYWTGELWKQFTLKI